MINRQGVYIICLLCFLLFAIPSVGQVVRRANATISKEVKHKARLVHKEGWRAFSGDPSLTEQLDNYYFIQTAFDEDGNPKYILEVAIEADTVLQIAESKAIESAKIALFIDYDPISNISNVNGISEENADHSYSYNKIHTNISLTETETTIQQIDDNQHKSQKMEGVYLCMGEEVYSFTQKQSLTNDILVEDFSSHRINSYAAERTCFQLPYIKAARTIFRAYRKTKDNRYEVIIRLMTPSQTFCTKIGDLYYYLNIKDSFSTPGDSLDVSTRPYTAIVTYHWDYANLDSVTIPAKVEYNGESYKVIGVCDNAFYYGNNIREVTYPHWINMSKAHVPETAQLIPYNLQPPMLTIVPESLIFKDSNENNCIDANEKSTIRFTITNQGKGVAENCEIKVNVSGATNGISVETIKLPTIAANQSFDISIPVKSDMNTIDGKAEFSIEVYEPSGWGIAPFNLTVTTKAYEPPHLQLVDYRIASQSGEIHKMESFTLSYTIQNTQYGNAEDVKVRVNIPNYVYVVSGETELSFPVIKAGESKSNQIVLIANNNYTNTNIPIFVELKEKHGKYADDKTITIELAQTVSPLADITVQEEKKRFKIVSVKDNALIIPEKPSINILQNTSVSILRPEWFNRYDNPQNIKSPFPYAVIRLELKGDKEAIDLAKERLSLVMGGKHIVEVKDTKETNTIWFLVHCRNEYIDLDCGDGCEPINIWKERLEPNRVYTCPIEVTLPDK